MDIYDAGMQEYISPCFYGAVGLDKPKFSGYWRMIDSA